MEFYNNRVAAHLLDVPLEYLIKELNKEIDERDSRIERKVLRNFLIKNIPIFRRSIPETIKYPKLTNRK